MSSLTGLEAPLLLAAMPQVRDPFFQRSVILLIAREEGGSLGYIVNRPLDLKMSSVLNDLEIAWQGSNRAVAYLGGPVQPQVGTVLFLANGPHDEASEVAPGIFASQSVETLRHLAGGLAGEVRLFLGHAGWASGQLEEEVQRHDWLICPADARFIFSLKPEEVWENVVRSADIDPVTLPEWTATGEVN